LVLAALPEGESTIDTIIAFLSDLHSGLRLSLLNPATRLLDANGQTWTPELTKTQRYLWSLYMQHRDQVRELARNRRLLLFLLGDLTQGLRHWSGVWGTTLYDHVVGALAVLEPWLELEPAAIRLVEGTEVHTENGATELLIARELSRLLPHCDVQIAQHYKTHVGSMVLDYAHHGPGVGRYQWTRGNVASSYLKAILLGEIIDGDEPPRLVVRAHVHDSVRRTERLETKRGTFEADIAICPGYCGINPHARKTMRSPLTQTHGMIAAVVDDAGEPDIRQLNEVTDVRTEEWL
jgi:hypothetical protein